MSDIIEQESDERQEDEELPVLTAQRFLNIFRQIHIFSEKKKKQFDEELLALPSEVIKALGSLPGTSLLLAHIDELKGFSASTHNKKTEIVEENLKSTTKKSREIVQSAEIENQQIVTPMFNAVAQPQYVPMPMSENFSENFTSSLVAAFEKIESKHNKEMTALMNGIMTTLNAIVDKLGKTENADIITSSTTETNADRTNLAEIINGAMNTQAQILSKAVNEQTKAITEVIASGLENRVAYASQENNLQPKEEYIPHEQTVTVEGAAYPEEIVPKTADTTTETVLPEDYSERKDNKTKKEKKKKHVENDGQSIETTTYSQINNFFNDLEENSINAEKDDNTTDTSFEKAFAEEANNNNWSWDKLDDIQAAIEKDAQERQEMQQEQPIEDQPVDDDNGLGSMVNELIDLDDDKPKDDNTTLSDFIPDNSEILDSKENEEPQVIDEENEELNISENNLLNESEEEIPSLTDIGQENPDNNENWEWEYDEGNKEVTAPVGGENNADEDWEWEYEEIPEDEADNQSDEDWEWEYEEDEDTGKK